MRLRDDDGHHGDGWMDAWEMSGAHVTVISMEARKPSVFSEEGSGSAACHVAAS